MLRIDQIGEIMYLTVAAVVSNPKLRETLMRTFFELELSVRSQNVLRDAGIQHVWQLVEKTETDLLKTKNFGRKALNEIKEILQELGLQLGSPLTFELKIVLGIAPKGSEPREIPSHYVHLPSLEEIDQRIASLTWLRDNYDAVKKGAKALDWP